MNYHCSSIENTFLEDLIADKVDELMELCDKFKASFANAQTTQRI